MPEVSVVIPSYAGAARLPRLLDALLAQEGCDWEAVVVLDGVLDDSPEIVESYAARGPVRLVALPENRGRPAALNAGFAAATGSVLVRCDDDLEPPPTFAAAHRDAHAHAEGQVGIVGPCPDVFPPGSAYATAYGRAADERIRAYSYGLPEDEAWRLWSGNVSVTRETYDAVGEYDESFRTYGWEDVDWGYRLHLLGVPVRAERSCEALHHNPPLTVGARAGRAFDAGEARARFEAKHGPTAVAALGGSAGTLGPGGWNRLVSATAHLLTPSSLPTLARAVDVVLPYLPAPFAEKAAALVVESAAVAAARARATRPNVRP